MRLAHKASRIIFVQVHGTLIAMVSGNGSIKRIMQDYWQRTSRYAFLFWAAIGTGTLVQLTTIASPLYLKDFLDLVAAGSPTNPVIIRGLYSALFFFAALTFAGWALRRVEFMAMYRLESRVM